MNYIKQDLYNEILINLPIVCVDVAVVNNDNKILLVKRKYEPAKNEWWLLGGRLYKGENLENCAKRKVKEEVGLDCDIIKQIHIAETIFNTGPNNIPIHSINICYLVKSKNENIILDKTSLDYKWIGQNDNSYHSCLKEYLDKSFNFLSKMTLKNKIL